MKKQWPSKLALRRQTLGYIAVVAGCFMLATLVSWTDFAHQVDSDVYDRMSRQNPPPASAPHSVVLAIDEATLNAMGGMRKVRTILADTLEQLRQSHPRVVVLDIILADKGDPAEDKRLAQAFANTPNLVLPTDVIAGQWEDPLPAFLGSGTPGHTISDNSSLDGVTRQLPLETIASHKRRWALSLEAFRVYHRVPEIQETLDELHADHVTYPKDMPLRIRYLSAGLPRISVKDFLERPALRDTVRDKAVFLGIYSETAARDRVTTPYGDHIPGVEVNAEAFETLERADFLFEARSSDVAAACLLIALSAGLTFRLLSGWPAYLLGLALLGAAHTLSFYLFGHSIVFPYFAPVSTAWFTVAGAASYQHFVVQRELRRSESERTRYRQAIHFVTHEMRTPLTAIQGSSELIGRYNLNDDKRKQMAQMINAESKRLARMIQTFLDVERLSDGQIELKSELFEVHDLVESCLERARPLAARKNIAIHVEGELDGTLRGDKELMEYAVYNLLTNAVKYSSAETEIRVRTRAEGERLLLSVQDQGMGMDESEVKKIFQRFYRTRRAEASGEQGSGIGLSIVDQIVRHHGGHMEVTSTPGEGSCFTMVVPAVRVRRPSPV